MISPICRTLALYDWKGDWDPIDFHVEVEAFFTACSTVPNEIHLVKKGGGQVTVPMAELSSAFRKLGSSLIACEYYHSIPNYAQLVFGWDVACGFSTSNGRTIVMSCAADDRGVGITYLEDVVIRLSRSLRIGYGIAYVRKLQLGPKLYAHGVSAGLGYSDAEEREGNEIANWFYERRGPNRHLQGLLRDVYPLNILTKVHVNHLVGPATLQEWIATSVDRGTLREANENLWLWRLEEDQIPSVRRELSNAGMLIATLGPFS